MEMKLDIYSIEWEFEDELPKDMSDLDYDLMYPKSEVIGGVRMFPYIEVYNNNGDSKRCYIGV